RSPPTRASHDSTDPRGPCPRPHPVLPGASRVVAALAVLARGAPPAGPRRGAGPCLRRPARLRPGRLFRDRVRDQPVPDPGNPEAVPGVAPRNLRFSRGAGPSRVARGLTVVFSINPELAAMIVLARAALRAFRSVLRRSVLADTPRGPWPPVLATA